MLKRDELGRLRHVKEKKQCKTVECYSCGHKYIGNSSPLLKIGDSGNYVCKECNNKVRLV